MKFVWEAIDIIAGIVVQSPKTNEKFVIGTMNLEDGRGDVFALVSVIGAQIFPPHGLTRNEMADRLNAIGALPIKSS